MKKSLISIGMGLLLLFAITPPLDSGFWMGVLRGVLIVAFVNMIPVWVKVSSND